MQGVAKTRKMSWRAREIVREVNDRPHVLIAVEIEGTHFPHRAVEAFVRVVEPRGRSMECWFAEVSEDNRRLKGYFPLDLPKKGRIEFGYAGQVLGTLPIEFDTKEVQTLDRKRLPRETVLTKEKDIPERRIPQGTER